MKPSDFITESPIEDLFLDEILPRLHAMVKVETQKKIRFPKGRGIRSDFHFVARKMVCIVECDGREFHDYGDDLRRDVICLALGVDDIFRFKGTDIYFDAKSCVDEMERILPYLFSDVPPLSAEEKAMTALNWRQLDVQPIHRFRTQNGPGEIKSPNWKNTAKGRRIWNLGSFIGANLESIISEKGGVK